VLSACLQLRRERRTRTEIQDRRGLLDRFAAQIEHLARKPGDFGLRQHAVESRHRRASDAAPDRALDGGQHVEPTAAGRREAQRAVLEVARTREQLLRRWAVPTTIDAVARGAVFEPRSIDALIRR
jgi:hypothetical protein